MHPFRAAVEAGDLDAAVALLHPDCTFHSPAVFRPYEGKDATALLLRTVVEVFEDFSYVDELEGDDTHGLVFTARVGDRTLTGWDYLRMEDGLIREFTVMVRPLSALQALVAEMGARLGT
jgi:hypothetical protein